MSIKELLSKVTREESVTTVTAEKIDKEVVSELGSVSKTTEIRYLTFQELLESYTVHKSWLETHECQTGTENKLDINDRPYDHEMYCKKLIELEDIVCEIFSRPLTDGLELQIKKFGL